MADRSKQYVCWKSCDIFIQILSHPLKCLFYNYKDIIHIMGLNLDSTSIYLVY